jgi:UDPglucose 6-dehydrogenase
VARIFIIGSGVVGTATGRGFAAAGHHVTFIDVLPSRLAQLQAEGCDARADIDLGDEPAFIFLTLPTPHRGRSYDLSAFESGVVAVGHALRDTSAMHTVVVRSTVPPRTTEGLVKVALERTSGKQVDQGFALASNPEFLRAASAVSDFGNPWMTVIAARNPATQGRLRELLAPFGGELRVFDDPATAELIKCSHNIFNAAKISFWNEMWLVAKELNVDLNEVSATVALSAEGSFNPSYGIRGGAPYGGVCLPKDTNGFLGFAGDLGVEMPLLDAVVRVNERLEAIESREIDALLTEPAPTVMTLPDAASGSFSNATAGGRLAE